MSNENKLGDIEVNALNYSVAKKIDPNLPDAILPPTDITWLSAYNRHIGSCKMRKDSADENNKADLQYVGSPYSFHNDEIRDNCILLVPVLLCDYYTLKLAKREHAILVIIDTGNLSIKVLDSQSAWRTYIYDDVIKKILDKIVPGKTFRYDPAVDYKAFGVQENFLSAEFGVACGYYVFLYLKHFLETGTIDGCEKIRLGMTAEFSKHEFLNKHGVDILPQTTLSDDEFTDEKNNRHDREGEDELEILLTEEKKDPVKTIAKNPLPTPRSSYIKTGLHLFMSKANLIWSKSVGQHQQKDFLESFTLIPDNPKKPMR